MNSGGGEGKKWGQSLEISRAEVVFCSFPRCLKSVGKRRIRERSGPGQHSEI